MDDFSRRFCVEAASPCEAELRVRVARKLRSSETHCEYCGSQIVRDNGSLHK